MEHQPTQEMIDFYKKRTQEHIDGVREAIKTIVKSFPELKQELLIRGEHHDESKYSVQEQTPYIWLTWYYKHKNAGIPYTSPPGIKELAKEASNIHVKTNRHHPQAHEKASNMSNVDIGEMIADHAAMSRELNNSLREWTKNNTLPKNEFTPIQEKLIWEMVSLFEQEP